MSKLILGVGINDSKDPVTFSVKTGSGRKICSYYSKWHNMLLRCYSDKYRVNHPAYHNATMNKDWVSFMAFKEWLIKDLSIGFNGLDLNKTTLYTALDKDLLVQGNTEYGPDTCLVVSREANAILLDSYSTRGEWPVGVHWHSRDLKFVAKITENNSRVHLGYHSTAMEAHRAWQVKKKSIVLDFATEQTDERVRNALLSRCTQLQYEIDNNLETIKL